MPSREELLSEIAHFEGLCRDLASPETPQQQGMKVVYGTLAAYGRKLLLQVESQDRHSNQPEGKLN